ncbi:MAG: carboxylesterase family protein [Planctomycetes bacterium]|nr:carboxylesterase family protein [Planctomycetota bacterium]
MRNTIASFLLAFLVLVGQGRAFAQRPVRIKSGLITGEERIGVRIYRGIPFAAPPIGDLRWKPPQPVAPWDGVRTCVQYGPSCPQPTPLMGPPPTNSSEDCLYLNVWTPVNRGKKKLPVMVWIHGGGFTTGSGSGLWYDGSALARQGVVVVTINYRLGPFGFLAHPLLSKESERNVSGNYGMLDQIEALKWVQENIAAFGGDPGCVTIFGESAGSASVCRLMVSPLTKGLFHRAIAESGGAHGRNRHLRERWYGLEPMEKEGERIVRSLGCHNAADPIAALREKSSEEILNASNAAQGLFGKGFKFGPVIDGWVLPDDPSALFEEGKQHNVPFMTGTNADEGTIFLQQVRVKRPMGYRWFMRILFGGQADEMLRLFPVSKVEDIPDALNRVTTVTCFVAPARALVRAMDRIGGTAYLYHFTRVPPSPKSRQLGCFHALEILYVFGNVRVGVAFNATDRKLSDIMSACWVRFATTGNPNGEGIPEWPVYHTETDRYLEFGDEIKVKSGLYREACDLMEKRYASLREGRFGK